MKPHLNVVAAVIVKEEDRIVICQRNEDDAFGLLWEFPGGTVEKGESSEEAIIREMREELGVEIGELFFLSTFEDETENLKITVSLFRAVIKEGVLQALDCKDFRIIKVEEAGGFDLAPVDKKIARFLEGMNPPLFSGHK